MIRAAIFDYGGVLMRTADPRPRRELEQRFGLPPGGVGKLVFQSTLWDEAQLGHITGAEFWANVVQHLGLNAEELAEFRRAFWAGDRMDEELVALIRHLHNEGYRTGLLSNAPAGLRSHLGRLAISDAFDVTVISGEEGVMKPDPEIFERTLARVGVPAEGAVFVDDSGVNVAAACQVGMQATRFRGLAPLRKWLQDLGLPTSDPDLAPVPDVRTVIFGWGGVLESVPDEARVAEWERRLGLAPGTLLKVLWGPVWRQLSVGSIAHDDYARHVADQLGLPDVATSVRFIEEFHAVGHLNPEVRAAVRSLRGRYRVALLANAAPGKEDRIREKFGLDVRAEFDAYVNSADVGLRKPDPAIFALVLDRLGVAPDEAILVDSGLRSVDTARELGIHAVQFVDSATTLAELEALLGHPVTE